jgi:thiamine-phosphate pyrophosphorylase
MTKLIVISNEQDIRHEAAMVNALFECGMELFHLRKPGWSIEQQRKFLKQFDPSLHTKISVHQHHALAEEFGLKYIHVKESLRSFYADSGWANIRQKKSTSFHSYEKLKTEGENFDYCFLSPVFDSVSKQSFGQQISPGLTIGPEIKTKVFALSGITRDNIESVFDRGFYGAAVLGSIWNEPKKALQHFIELHHLCTGNVHTY